MLEAVVICYRVIGEVVLLVVCSCCSCVVVDFSIVNTVRECMYMFVLYMIVCTERYPWSLTLRVTRVFTSVSSTPLALCVQVEGHG